MANTGNNSRKRAAPSYSEEATRDVVMDSLPYYDVVHEDYEQYALALIEEEMKNRSAPDLDSLPPIKFRTPLMEQEYQRLIDTDGKALSTEWIITNMANPPGGDDENDVEAWRTAVKQARSEYEAERAHSMALEARKDNGAAVLWKGFNDNLDKELAALRQAVSEQKERVEQINLYRSEEQQKVGKQLHILTDKYKNALGRRFQLQQALLALENEVEQSS